MLKFIKYFIANRKTLKTVATSQLVHNNNRSEKSKLININLRSVVAITSAGGGLTSFRKFCTDLNHYLHHIENFTVKNCKRSMKKAAQELRTLILNGESEIDQVLDVAVSVDGSWQKRYFKAISIDTECVLDYVIKTNFYATYVKPIQMPVISGKNFIKKIAALITQEAVG